jgi:hypothetical protein
MLTVFVAGSWNWTVHLWKRYWYLPSEQDKNRVESGPKVRELFLPPDEPTSSWRKNGDPCKPQHRSLCGAGAGP